MDEKRHRLSQIQTIWPLVHGAQNRETLSAESRKAATELLMRYQEGIYAYLLGALRDADAANEVFQDFALKFVRRDFYNANADPSRGRFRGTRDPRSRLHHQNRKEVPLFMLNLLGGVLCRIQRKSVGGIPRVFCL